MPNERIVTALSRINLALSRIEAHGTAPPPGGRVPVVRDGRSDVALAELQARHNRLRDGTADALARLDGLIDAAAGGGAG